MSRALIAVALALAAPGLAQADNHFLLELEAGLTSPIASDGEASAGTGFGGTFGFGGRIPGFAPAYYLVGRVAHSAYEVEGAPRIGRPLVAHGELEIAVGGRMYLPLTQRLRLVLQVGFGEVFGESEVQREGTRELLVESETFALFAQGGLQFRLTDHFSLGAAADASFLPDRSDLEVARLASGLDELAVGRTRLALTTTFHF
ncbi:MAG: hypothetical protein KC549_00620 [Myxococcales bacterium]|nr:hypothetical protein [Myxococcales bacterium]MCB9549236.1 hypothetical protein [Myxococcales bacterium]